MPAYLVRTIKTHDLVGVFFAANLYDLAYMIDEVLDPDVCEYKLLGAGGVVWSQVAISIPIPTRDDDDDDQDGDDVPWADARFTESWFEAVYYDNRKEWRKVPYSVEDIFGIDPELPDPDEPPSNQGQIVPFKKPKKPAE